jgi:hypothetical protein
MHFLYIFFQNSAISQNVKMRLVPDFAGAGHVWSVTDFIMDFIMSVADFLCILFSHMEIHKNKILSFW